MIVKKIKREKSNKPKVWQIGDLVDYIRNPRTGNAYEKIGHAGSRNFLSGTHSGQIGEMIALAQESVRSKSPVSHFIFSWKESEQPTRANVDELVDIFLTHMGLTEHQTVYGLHHNTNNFHVHIAVNRVHPYTLKVVRPNNGFDIEAAHRVVALVEHKQGWASEDNTRYTVLENGEVIRARREQKPPQPRQEALAVERATGEKSAQRIAQERGHDIIKHAQSWPELHEKLAMQGLCFEKKGSGAIVFVGDIAVKASSVDRDFGMSKLCKRLGEFVPAPAPATEEERDTPPPPLAPEPVSEVNLEEWQQYQAERQAAHQEPPNIETQTRLQVLKAQQREERQRILPTLAKYGLHILNIARHFLKLRQREERQQARQAMRPVSTSRKPRFETWLRDRGLHVQADRWRHRKRFEPPVQAIQPMPTVQTAQTAPAAAYMPQAIRQQMQPRRPAYPAPRPTDTTAAYFTHFENIRKHLNVEDFSRLDAMIALRLRANGHNPQAVAETIRQCAPTIRSKNEGRDWHRYAERTAAYAFGVVGDVALARNERHLEHWKKIEGLVEREKRQEAPRVRMR